MKLRTFIYAALGLTAFLMAGRFGWLWHAERLAQRMDAQQISADLIAAGASRLLVVTQDNLLFANERSAQQWASLHRNLKADLGALLQSEPIDAELLNEMETTLADLQVLFDRLQVVRQQLQGDDEEVALDILRGRLMQALRQVSDQAFAYAADIDALRLAERQRQRHLVLLFNVLLLLVVVVLAHVLLRRVLQPLHRLADTAQHVHERGDLGRRVNSGASDEMGLTARSFDAMLDRLDAAQGALEQALAEQRREREVLASIIEGTNVGTWAWNVQTGETRFNERWAAMIGRSLQELQPTDIHTWMAHAHPEDVAQSGALLQAHFEGHKPYYECEARMRHRDGHWIWVLDRGRVFTRTADGQPEWMYGTHQDITARKEQEALLRRNEAFLARVGVVAGVGGWEYDLLTGAMRWSEETRRIAEVDAGFVPTRENLIDFIEPGERSRLDGLMQALLDHGRAYDGVFPWITGQGRRLWVRATGEPVYDQSQPPVLASLVGSIQDITAERQASDALAQAKAQAEAANQAKSRFLASMSHELRTPLNALLGIQRLLGDSLLDQRQREWLSKASSAGKSLLGIINDVLDLARIEAGELPLVVSAVRLREIAHSITDVYGVQARAKGLSLLLDVSPEVPAWTRVDAERLRQALTNLIGNAIKFTERGSVVLRLEGFSEEGKGWMRWSISDSGPGIEPAALERLFQPFVQADESITRRFGGTGLGLSIVRQLAGLMGGRVRAESEPGRGSTFHLELPLSEPAEEEIRRADLGTRAVAVVLHCANPFVCDELQTRFVHLGWLCEVVHGQRMAPVMPADLCLVDAALGPDGVAAAVAWRDAPGAAGNACHWLLVGTDAELLALERAGVRVPQAGIHRKPTSATAMFQAVIDLLSEAPDMQERLFNSDEALVRGVRWLDGLRVLVVDDNPINREVATELLRDQGAVCHPCEDGQQALDWLALHGHEVDAVLMDVQMPVLDGLSACRRIKADPAMARLPVLALTAGVLASEREAALAAGMDGFLSKPIVPSALVRHLRNAVTRIAARSVAVSLDTSARVAAAVQDWPAFPGIDPVRARESCSHNPALYKRLLRLLIGQYGDWTEHWTALAAQPDAGALQRLRASLHKLHGSAATLGAGELAVVVMQAEHDLARSPPDMVGVVARVSAALQALLGPLMRWHSATPAGLPTPPDRLSRADLRWLQTLSKLLDRHDLDAVEWVSQGEGEVTRILGNAQADALRSAVESLDFYSASRVVSAAIRSASGETASQPPSDP